MFWAFLRCLGVVDGGVGLIRMLRVQGLGLDFELHQLRTKQLLVISLCD